MMLQVWIVIVTIGVLVIAILNHRMMSRFLHRAGDDISELTLAVRKSTAKIDAATDEARALLALLGDCVPPVQRVVDRFEALGRRAADLSSTLLEEVGRPAFTAAAIARGARLGVDHFVQRLMNRFTHRSNAHNGGNDHE